MAIFGKTKVKENRVDFGVTDRLVCSLCSRSFPLLAREKAFYKNVQWDSYYEVWRGTCLVCGPGQGFKMCSPVDKDEDMPGECPVCFSIVMPKGFRKHTEWHIEMMADFGTLALGKKES